jgi:predicted transcriptional regulator
MENLTRKDREALVVELDRQGKTYREIATEARMSPRDIKRILKKGSTQQNQSVQSQAYKFFSEGSFTSSYCVKPRGVRSTSILY